MSQIACPKHLSVYMRGSIPDRYTADPTIDPTDDECLRDIGFTDVSDGTTEDNIIALIDAGSETEFEADEICDTDSASEDTDEQSLDDEAATTPVTATSVVSFRKSVACAKPASNRFLAIEERLGNVTGFVGVRRYTYGVLGWDIFENRMTARRYNATHNDCWKRRKVAKQYLRHELRLAD